MSSKNVKLDSLGLPSLSEPALFNVDNYKWEMRPVKSYTSSKTAVAALVAKCKVFGFELLEFQWLADEADLVNHGDLDKWEQHVKYSFACSLQEKMVAVAKKKMELASRLATIQKDRELRQLLNNK